MIEPAISGGGKELGCGPLGTDLAGSGRAQRLRDRQVYRDHRVSGAKEGENGTGFWRFSSGLWRPSSYALAK
jgi:hypothetical protein